MILWGINLQQEKILPTNDLMFKKTFATEGNEDITIGLIKDFFGLTAKELILKTPYSIDEYMELLNKNEITVLRQTIKDIRASIITADFIAELQMKKLRYFDERFFYYLCDNYCSNYNSTEVIAAKNTVDNGKKKFAPKLNRYSSLRPVYALNILGESHYPDMYPFRIFEPYDPKRNLRPSTQLYKQAFLELSKDGALETVNQKYWRDFFISGEVADEAPGYIRRASEFLTLSNLSGKERESMKIMEKAIADYEAELEYAQYEGYQQGVEVGRQQGVELGLKESKLEIARSLLAENIPIDIIRKVTELDLETIKNLGTQSS